MKKKTLILIIILALFIPTGGAVFVWIVSKNKNLKDVIEIEVPQNILQPSMMYDFIEDSFYIEQDFVKRNQNLATLLHSGNVEFTVINRLAELSKPVFDVKHIRAGNKYTFLIK
jgi:galactose-1-phosphate uridylyltransferase